MRVRRLRRDDRAAMPVLEAILVAILVLTAIIFFTSVQRPTTGAEQGGIDLAKVAADTLQIMQARNFTGTGVANPEVWATNLLGADTTTGTADTMSAFLRGILPSGSRYVLRLDNGNGTLRLLPTPVRSVTDGVTVVGTTVTSATAAFTSADQGKPIWGGGVVAGSYVSLIPAGTTIQTVTSATTVTLSAAATSAVTGAILTIGVREQPFQGRAAEVTLLPNWSSFRTLPASPSAAVRVVYPGQVLDAGDALMGTTAACFEAPFSSATGPGGTSWKAIWQSAIQTGTTSNGKDNATAVGSGKQQVPKGLPFGKWRLSTAAAASNHCTGGTVSYVLVAPPGSRTLTASSGSTTLTSSAQFSPYDVGLPVSGTGIPAGAYVSSVTNSNTAVMSAAATAGAGASTTIPAASTFMPYSLQLVVWFGA